MKSPVYRPINKKLIYNYFIIFFAVQYFTNMINNTIWLTNTYSTELTCVHINLVQDLLQNYISVIYIETAGNT